MIVEPVTDAVKNAFTKPLKTVIRDSPFLLSEWIAAAMSLEGIDEEYRNICKRTHH